MLRTHEEFRLRHILAILVMEILTTFFQRKLTFPLFSEAGTACIVSANAVSGVLPRTARMAGLHVNWVVEAMQNVWFEELALHGLEPDEDDTAKGLMKEWLTLLRATVPVTEQEPRRASSFSSIVYLRFVCSEGIVCSPGGPDRASELIVFSSGCCLNLCPSK